MDLNSKLKTKRSKSEAYNDKSFLQYKNKYQKIPRDSQINDQVRRCHCCNEKKHYPDYLAQLRKQRIQKMEKKAIAQVLMQTPIPLVQSKHISEQMMTHSPQQHNFISKMSNKVSEYEQTPPKSILQSFHESIIKSHSKKSSRSSHRNVLQKNSQFKTNNVEDEPSKQFIFQIRVQNPELNEFYVRRFTAPQYGAMAVGVIQEILSKVN